MRVNIPGYSEHFETILYNVNKTVRHNLLTNLFKVNCKVIHTSVHN